jgi:hypothetical protein
MAYSESLAAVVGAAFTAAGAAAVRTDEAGRGAAPAPAARTDWERDEERECVCECGSPSLGLR